MWRISIRFIVCIFLSLLVVGCSIPKKAEVLPPGQYELAILPMANETTNLDGPVLIRKAIYNKLKRFRRFSVVPLEETDSVLKGLAITDGGQLGAVSAVELGKKIPARQLVYSNLKTFKPLRVVALEVIKVNVRICDARTGSLLWDDDFAVMSQTGELNSRSLEEYFKYFKYIVLIGFIEKLFHAPLNEEINILTDRICQNFYYRR